MNSRDTAPPLDPRATDPLPTGDAAPMSARVTDALSGGDRERPPVREGDVLLGKYRVEGVLGEGGMGIVLAAMHLQLRTRVALKLMRSGRERRGFAVARFLREARAATRIKGEHVARVMDVGTLETGTPYMAMEHLTGRDLGAELRARGPLPVDEAVEYVLQACEAVAEAHAAGIVHRDLKPSNLFLTRRADGSPLVKVLDFGIAKALDEDREASLEALTASCAVLGSPVYMSPEQIRSPSDVDPRTDVWSLGVILYELLSGELPFAGASVAARLAAIAADPPIPLAGVRSQVPARLESVILRCLDKKVDQRMPDVAALARALAPFASPRAAGSIERVEALAGGRGSPLTAGESPGRQRPWIWRRVGGAILALSMLSVGAFLWRRPALSAGERPEAHAPTASSIQVEPRLEPLATAAPSEPPPEPLASAVAAPVSMGEPPKPPAQPRRDLRPPRATAGSSAPSASSASPAQPVSSAAPVQPASSARGSDVDTATAHRK